MALCPGKIYQFKVDRKTPIGYMLTNHDDELFLHEKEAHDIEVGTLIDAFVYIDAHKRMAATMAKPLLTLNQSGWLTVVSRHPKLGVFLNLGINKDVLLSADELPLEQSLWPDVDDQLYVSLRFKNRLFVSLLEPPTKHIELDMGSNVEAIVYKYTVGGIKLVTDHLVHVYVHESQYDLKPKVGERVQVKIIYHSEKGYSGSMSPQKEMKRLDDADLIYTYVETHGTLPLDATSSPETIAKYFDMSKKAFKRALGHLYKLRKVKFEDGKTIKVEDIYD
ncbi:MAG: S1-like domain-containing RNA-binding protein [Acholeplasmataceae bacterium]